MCRDMSRYVAISLVKSPISSVMSPISPVKNPTFLVKRPVCPVTHSLSEKKTKTAKLSYTWPGFTPS